jgi:hypothetical protein
MTYYVRTLTSVRKESKLNSDGGDFGSKKAAVAAGSAECAFGRSLESGCRLYVGTFGRNLVLCLYGW